MDLSVEPCGVAGIPWESLGAIEAWHELAGWKERVGRIRSLLDHFEPHPLDLVVERR